MFGDNSPERSAVVLAGGSSSRIGQDKGILELAGKPLLKHVIEAIRDNVDQIVVVTSSHNRIKKYSALISESVQFAIDQSNTRSPLIGTMSGLSVAQGKYSLLLPFDTPFVSSQVVSLLFELCIGKGAAIPKWPNGEIEPLHAVYNTQSAQNAANRAIGEGQLDMRGMIERIRGVRYISTLVIQQLDPEYRTFFNINARADLEKAATMIKKQKP